MEWGEENLGSCVLGGGEHGKSIADQTVVFLPQNVGKDAPKVVRYYDDIEPELEHLEGGLVRRVPHSK